MLPTLLGLLMAHDLHAAPAPHPEPPAPTLHLDGVTLGTMSESNGSVDITLSCAARWENSGEPLPAQTAFQSVFDGVTLVAIDRHGAEVVRQHYTWHQSPFSPSRTIPLPSGETAQTLTFPISGVPLSDMAQVRLEGGLVGNEAHSEGMVTEWQRVLVFR